MANLAFSKKKPWEEVKEAMTKYALEITDGAFEVRCEEGAICLYAEGPDTVPEGWEGYMLNPPSAYKEGARLKVRFEGWRALYYTVPHGYLKYMWSKEKRKSKA
jgi:hypothetical protein